MSEFGKRGGILGSGFGTRITARALRDEHWDIRGLFSRRPARAKEIAEKLEIFAVKLWRNSKEGRCEYG